MSLSALASEFREPIEFEGTFSERLHAGLDEYWTIFRHWFPARFFPVDLRFDGYAEGALFREASTSSSRSIDI